MKTRKNYLRIMSLCIGLFCIVSFGYGQTQYASFPFVWKNKTYNAIGTLVTLSTPNGSSVYAYSVPEKWSNSIKTEITNHYTQNYPLATILATATTTYNCHSYAWNMKEYGPTCWLDAETWDSTTHMSRYWTDDSYVETSLQYAEKIYYSGSSGAHSAIPSSTVSGMYESKWGPYTLMRHSIGYGPADYQMNGTRVYYAKYPYISGHRIISNSYNGTFSVNCIPLNTTLTWTADESIISIVSYSGTNVVVKPKTTSSVGVGTLTANFKNSSGTVVYSCSFSVYTNRLPTFSGLSLRVVRSSDGTEVYPSYVGLCPNSFYYAYLTGASSNYSYNWDMNHATVYSSSSSQAYFKTDDQGWTFLDLYATDSTSGVTGKVYGVTLYGGSDCD